MLNEFSFIVVRFVLTPPSLSLSHIYTLMIVKSNVTVYPIVLEDAVDADLLSILHETTSFFSSKREENEKILVFCNAGVSRSVAVVLAHIVWKKMKKRKGQAKAKGRGKA